MDTSLIDQSSSNDVPPACYWALSADTNTIESLIWATDEFAIRYPLFDEAYKVKFATPSRCRDGLCGLYHLVYQRQLTTTHDDTNGLFVFMKKKPIHDLTLLARPHTLLKQPHTDEASLQALCRDQQLLTKVSHGKYTRWWTGDWEIVLVLIYLVGRLVLTPKEDVEYPRLLAILSQIQHRSLNVKFWKRHSYESLVEEARQDLDKALAWKPTASSAGDTV